jgi:hypothetical protein
MIYFSRIKGLHFCAFESLLSQSNGVPSLGGYELTKLLIHLKVPLPFRPSNVQKQPKLTAILIAGSPLSIFFPLTLNPLFNYVHNMMPKPINKKFCSHVHTLVH